MISPSWKKRLQQFDRSIVALEKAILLILFLAIAMLVALGIFSRQSRVVIPWTNEAAQLLLVWMIFFGANMGTHFRDHVGVTILPDVLPGRARIAAFFLIRVAILAFSAYVVWAGWSFVQFQMMVGGTTFSLPVNIPNYVVAIGLPASFTAGCIHVIVDLLTRSSTAPYSGLPLDENPTNGVSSRANSSHKE